MCMSVLQGVPQMFHIDLTSLAHLLEVFFSSGSKSKACFMKSCTISLCRVKLMNWFCICKRLSFFFSAWVLTISCSLLSKIWSVLETSSWMVSPEKPFTWNKLVPCKSFAGLPPVSSSPWTREEGMPTFDIFQPISIFSTALASRSERSLQSNVMVGPFGCHCWLAVGGGCCGTCHASCEMLPNGWGGN